MLIIIYACKTMLIIALQNHAYHKHFNANALPNALHNYVNHKQYVLHY